MKKITSVYIHIPFCDSICSYCDFCKVVYNHDWIMPYLEKLSEEIDNSYLGGRNINFIYWRWGGIK